MGTSKNDLEQGVSSRATRKPTPRNLRPRATAAIPIAPATVTNRTSHAVLGLDDADFRRLLVTKKIPHERLGRLVIARVADVLASLSLEAPSAVPETMHASGGADDEPATADDVLRRLGMRRAS